MSTHNVCFYGEIRKCFCLDTLFPEAVDIQDNWYMYNRACVFNKCTNQLPHSCCLVRSFTLRCIFSYDLFILLVFVALILDCHLRPMGGVAGLEINVVLHDSTPKSECMSLCSAVRVPLYSAGSIDM